MVDETDRLHAFERRDLCGLGVHHPDRCEGTKQKERWCEVIVLEKEANVHQHFLYILLHTLKV